MPNTPGRAPRNPVVSDFQVMAEQPDSSWSAESMINIRIVGTDGIERHLAYAPESLAQFHFHTERSDSGDRFSLTMALAPGRHFVWEE